MNENGLLKKLKRYLEANYLHINVSKSKFLHFKPPRKAINMDFDERINFGGIPLESVEKIKFLGVLIDHKLSWKIQTQMVANKVRNSIGQLYDMRNVIPKKLRCTVYHSVVNSQLTYAITTWGGMTSYLQPLFLLQKRALRNLFGIKKVTKFIKGHTKEIFGNHNILSIYNIYTQMTLVHLFKLIQLKEPVYLCKLLKTEETYFSRNKRIYVPKLSLKHYKSNFCFTGPSLWNAINSASSFCNDITNAPSSTSFKRRLKRTLIEMQTYGDKIEWLPANNNMYLYLKAIKSDPYSYCN